MRASADLSAQLARGEGLHTEFKAWPLPADDLAAAIVAFANTDGGRVFLGVDDSGVAADGIGDLDRATQFVDSVAFNNCSPPVTVLQETLETAGGTVLAVNVPKGDHVPYQTGWGAYYVRTSTGRRYPSRGELLRLFQAGENLFYDETPVGRSTLSDRDESATDEMLEAIQDQGLDLSGIPRDRLLRNWGLIDDDGGDRLTVAGVLLLARAPQRFFPHAYVSALRIPGVDIATPPIDQKRIEGRLFDLLSDALRFLDFHLMRRHRIRGLEPEVVLEFPVACLRETLVNAVAHRDYTIAGPIRLLVFDDRVEVRTPGGLPNSVRLDQLPAGVHVLRNPTVYNLLLKRGLVSDAGSGIPRMIRLLREKTGHEPNLRLEGNEFVVALTRTNPG